MTCRESINTSEQKIECRTRDQARPVDDAHAASSLRAIRTSKHDWQRGEQRGGGEIATGQVAATRA